MICLTEMVQRKKQNILRRGLIHDQEVTFLNVTLNVLHFTLRV